MRECMFDRREATEEWIDGTPMCEKCFWEAVCDLTCDKCDDVTGEVAMRDGAAWIICRECGDQWLM